MKEAVKNETNWGSKNFKYIMFDGGEVVGDLSDEFNVLVERFDGLTCRDAARQAYNTKAFHLRRLNQTRIFYFEPECSDDTIDGYWTTERGSRFGYVIIKGRSNPEEKQNG